MFSWWFFLLLEYIFQQKVICTLFPQFINYLSTEYQRMMEFCWTFLVSFLFILENNLNTLTSPLSLLYHLVFIFLFLYALSIPFNHFGMFHVSFHWHFCAWLAVLFISCICYHLIEFTYIFSFCSNICLPVVSFPSCSSVLSHCTFTEFRFLSRLFVC